MPQEEACAFSESLNNRYPVVALLSSEETYVILERKTCPVPSYSAEALGMAGVFSER